MAGSSNSAANGLASLLQYITLLDDDEIEDLKAFGEGSHVDQDLDDEELARFLFAQEAASLLNMTVDHRSGSTDVLDRSLLDELASIEEMARFDHEMALALAEGRPPPIRPERDEQRRSGPLPDVSLDTASSSSSVSSVLNTPSSLNSTVSLPNIPLPVPAPALLPFPVIPHPLGDCVVCGDSIFHTIIELPCGHTLDEGCLQIMFRNACDSESNFPPKCCNEVVLADVREYLDKETADLFELKSVEYRTTNRVYCHRPTCSKYLAAATETSSYIECQACRIATCGACKEQAHIGRPCDKHVNSAVLELAEKEGWQRCHSCRHLVELTQGCFHMICLCKAQFCYLCATPWKECKCPQFAEERL